jgi:hypothetical protein
VTVSDLDARAKAHLAERMVPVAAEMACAVRDEDAAAIGERLEGLDRQELYGLVAVLAAMVPDGEPIGDLLAWAGWGEEATAILAAAQAPLPLTGKAAQYAELVADGVSRRDAAERLGVKVCTTYGYDEKIRKARREESEAVA